MPVRDRVGRLDYRPLRGQREIKAFADLTFQSFAGFGMPMERTRIWMRHIGHENLRLARVGGEIVGGLGLFDFGQYYGGKAVRTSGVTIVGMLPEHRAASVGLAMIRAMQTEQRRRGVPLSLLYPSTWGFYRAAGYETAGRLMRYKIDLPGWRPRAGAGEGLRIRPLLAKDERGVARFYETLARHSNGNISRGPRQWGRMLHLTHSSLYKYVIEEAARPQTLRGYFSLEQISTGYPYKIFLKDYRVGDDDALQALVRFLASHRTMAEAVEFEGGPSDPLLLSSEVSVSDLTLSPAWMLRILDVRKALLARGYPKNVTADLSLEIVDDFFDENSGRWTLQVRDGVPRVTPSPGAADVRLDVRGLASLYSGFRSAAELAVVGQASGDDAALQELSALFAGPYPWMNDRF